MSVQEMRTEMHRIVDILNEEQLYHLSRWRKEQLSGFVSDEYGVTIEEYNRDIDDAEAEINRGEYYTHEQVKAHFEEKFSLAGKVE